MFIPEAIELGVAGAEALAPVAEGVVGKLASKYGGKAITKAAKYAAKNPQRTAIAASVLSSSFNHHKEHLMHTEVADRVQTFKNKYGKHLHKIKVDHDPSAYYQRGKFPHDL